MSGSATDLLSIKTPLPETAFKAVGLSAREQLSRPFSYLVDLSSGTAALSPDSLIDQKVTVTLGDPETHGRYFNGVVQAVQQMPTANAALWSYRLTVVPKLWFLGQTQSSRFFQNMNVPDIVTGILDKFSVAYSKNLQGSYGKRDYTVQFNESYLHFVQRVLEDEGIFYFFEHTDSAHTMVLGDRKSAFMEIPNPSLTVREGAQGSYDLSSWHREDSSALGQVTVDDYDPATNTLNPAAIRGEVPTVLTPSGAPNRTHYTWPAVRGTTGDANTRAQWRMEAAEAAAQLYAGSGGPLDFFAGGVITVANDPTKAGGSGDYVLRSVTYQASDSADGTIGGSGSMATMSCTAFPADRQWREVPAFAAPVMAGLYTAKVIGPPGEEIYVDDLGRIKIWFPWDVEGDINEQDTLWVRVMQPWGGVGWGTQFVPRIGMEVVVAFLEGDVNRPMVIGSIYNSQQTPLFKAADKNKSGIRTRSTLQGGDSNYHELSFDDTKGSEKMLLHAEKDYQLEVENDQTLQIDNNRNVTVTKDETVTVNGKQTHTIKEDRTLTVSEGHMATTVSQGNRTAEVSMGNESLKVDLGTITYEAMQSITLKVGTSSIVIDNTGITMKGLMIQVSGDTLTALKGAMVQVNGSGMLTLAGGITMIN